MSTSHIEDCIINGGTSVDVPCPPDDIPCEGSPSGEASIWNPRNILGLSPDTKTVSERITAVEGQVIFTLDLFVYVIDTGALEIHKNGLLLAQNVEWVEQTSSTFQLVVPCTAGDQIVATGHVGITGNVDVRDTDIYVENYQNVRDYVGTETLLYAKGRVTAADGGQDFFILLIGEAPGYFTDDDTTILVPAGGDGSAAWVRRGDLNFGVLEDLVLSPSVSVGDIVQTFGYYTEGDSGANVYQIVNAFTGTADGGSLIDLVGTSFQAMGLFGTAPQDYNTRQWGAIGDGVTDDTLQIQRAVDFLFANNGGFLEFPVTAEGSKYRCNLVLQNSTSIRGKSREVELNPAIDAPIISVDPDALELNRLTIQLLKLNGDATKLTFLNQDGVYIAPAAGRNHGKINIVECIINSAGRRGVHLDASASLCTINEFVMHRSTVRNCNKSGLKIEGNAVGSKVSSTTINENGNENVEEDSNIFITESLSNGWPEDIAFDSCRFETYDYLVQGITIAVNGVLGLSITNCSFFSPFTAIKVDKEPNGQIIVQDCRLERNDAIPIVAMADLVQVNGFTWTNNNVSAACVGPVGILYSGIAEDLKKIDIESNNGWGALDVAASNIPPAILSGTTVQLPTRNGTSPITLAGDGTSNLETILDHKGGINQFVDGDEIVLHITNVARTVTVVHGAGNIRLNAASSFTLDGIAKILKLVWSSYSLSWIEITRSDNLVF